MGGTWQEGCPVGLDGLRYVTVSFRGFDGGAHTGELVVNADEAGDVVEAFRQLFDAGFPIEEMRLVTDADLAAPATGDGNNTAAFVCRAVRGGSRFSAHAYGLAIDLNPFQNPYISVTTSWCRSWPAPTWTAPEPRRHGPARRRRDRRLRRHRLDLVRHLADTRDLMHFSATGG